MTSISSVSGYSVFLFSCADNHFSRSFLSARCLSMSSSSNSEYLPMAIAFLKVALSMTLVRQSASIAWLLTHRSRQFSVSLSRINRHSKVVRNSSQTGVDVFVDRSNTDLQSVAIEAKGVDCRTSLGLVQFIPGSEAKPKGYGSN